MGSKITDELVTELDVSLWLLIICNIEISKTLENINKDFDAIIFFK